jgi:hypothetical protein
MGFQSVLVERGPNLSVHLTGVPLRSIPSGDFNVKCMNISQPQKNEFKDLLQFFKDCVENTVKNRKPIYLDTKYWIFLRDAYLGRAQKETHNDILQKIVQLNESGSIFCPVSDAVFIEVSKQSDENTRIPTAELMDELTNGIAIDTIFQRIESEIKYSIATKAGKHDISMQVWTKPCFVFGDVLFKHNGISEENNRELLKEYLTEMWKISFKEMLSRIPDLKDNIYQNYDIVADEINKNAKKHESEITSFDTAYEIEFIGIGSVFRECFLKNIFENIEGIPEVEKKPGVTKTKLNRAKMYPTLHIGALCHASVRWDKKRKIKGNDIIDFFHASAALPYCDAFFTDNPLKNILKSGNFNFSHQFSCEIFSGEDEVLKYLSEIEQSHLTSG